MCRFTNRHLPGDKQVRREVSPACHYEVSRRTVSYIPGQTDKELEEAKREKKYKKLINKRLEIRRREKSYF